MFNRAGLVWDVICLKSKGENDKIRIIVIIGKSLYLIVK